MLTMCHVAWIMIGLPALWLRLHEMQCERLTTQRKEQQRDKHTKAFAYQMKNDAIWYDTRRNDK